MRWCPLAVCALVAASCSGGDDPPASSGVATTTVGSSVAETESAGDGPDEPPAVTVSEEPVATVTVRVLAGPVEAELGGPVGESEDPFGRFVSCSGIRSLFASYSVLASEPESAVRSIGVSSVGVVDAPGVFDATMRIEPATGVAIDAVGTMTIDDGFRSGSFTGFDAEGDRVEGDFECEGPLEPGPIGSDDGDEALDTIEVSALLRSGDAERLVGLVASDEVAIECPGLSGAPGGDVLVRVVGDQAIGAISEFALTGGSAPSMRMTVGTTVYDFDRVDLGSEDSGPAGTFSGSDGDVTVDGAYRCR